MRTPLGSNYGATIPFLILAVCATVSAAPSLDCVFPKSVSIKNVRTDFGAKGDGKADDTKALQEAVYENCQHHGIIYLPNGVYRISSPLVFATREGKRMGIGPWMYGQNRDSVVIRLDDGAQGYQDSANPRPLIAATYHKSGDGISADQFMRVIHNLTLDAGRNPGAIGIRYYSNNVGSLRNVKIRGTGKIGLDLSWVNMNGPCLIGDVEIDGFGIGIVAGWSINSQTLSNIRISNCRTYGVLHWGQVLTFENLTIKNVPCGIVSHHPGILSVINSSFQGNDPKQPAIEDRGRIYVRNLTTKGFAVAIKGDSVRPGVAAAYVKEYVSNGVRKSFAGAPAASLNLPIKEPPPFTWEQDLKKWVCVNDFGAVFGDTIDDAPAFQKAIDSAAAAGKTTVYMNSSFGPDPNGYFIRDTVWVHGSVRHIVGLGFARVFGTGGFALRKDAAPVVKFQNLYSFGGWSRFLSKKVPQTVIVESCDGFDLSIAAPGEVFINDCVVTLGMSHPQARVWARQLNMEAKERIDADNIGGTLWALGIKTEHNGIKVSTTKGGKTEVVGGHMYSLCDEKKTPMFLIENASASFASVCEVILCKDKAYPQQVREIRGKEVKDYVSEDGHWPLYVGYGK